MPALDVAYILSDPTFAETVTIQRRAETVGADGISVQTATDVSISATVTSGSQPVLERNAGGQWQPDTIIVHTTFRLIGPAIGYQPDVVLWNGRRYLVTRTNDYSHYGGGFVRADCRAMDLQDSL